MLNYKILSISFPIGSQNSIINPVIIYNDSELILCDTGYPNQITQINEELKKYGFDINNVTKIVITHHDHDHIGSLKSLKEQNPKIQVISSKEEAPFINGSKESLRLIQAEKYNKELTGKDLEFGLQFVNYLKTIQNCEVDRIVKDGDYIINGLKVISTPGHTPGHISLYLEETGTFISGDSLVLENGKFMIANPEFALDLSLCKRSIDKVKKISPTEIICYHGGSINKNVKEMLSEGF